MRIVYSMTEIMLKSAEAGYLLVTGGAGMLVVYGKTAIIKQFSAQFKTFFAERIITERMNGSGKTCRNFLLHQCDAPGILFFFTGA